MVQEPNVYLGALMNQPATTICMLLYGDYPDIHNEAIRGLLHSDLSNAEVRIWCNAICRDTFRLLLRMPALGWRIYVNSANKPKYKLMRDIFNDKRSPITTPWVTWLDDDTLLQKKSWAIETEAFLRRSPSVDYCGRETNGRYYKGGYELVKASPWYKQVPFGKGISKHVYGAYWWMKTEVMRALDWPDKRLSHNGGDWLLSEALLQQGYKQVSFYDGVKIQIRAPRRGLSEVSLGRADKRQTSRSDRKIPSMLNKMHFYTNTLRGSNIDYIQPNDETIVFELPFDEELVGQRALIERKKAEIIAGLKRHDQSMPPSQPQRVAGPASRSAQNRRNELRQRALESRRLPKIVKEVKGATPVKMAHREPKSIKRILQDRRRRASNR